MVAEQRKLSGDDLQPTQPPGNSQEQLHDRNEHIAAFSKVGSRR